MRLTLEEAIDRYGKIENGIWKDETKWCGLFKVPETIACNWINTASKRRTEHIYINREMGSALAKALEMVAAQGLTGELKTFDGCFQIRDVRAEPGKPSAHSYALAIDINASTNQLGTCGNISPPLVKCFVTAGFTWGGGFKRLDPMHFSLAWE